MLHSSINNSQFALIIIEFNLILIFLMAFSNFQHVLKTLNKIYFKDSLGVFIKLNLILYL